MRLTEGLASTTAQALPIFALAASLEILAIHRSYGAEIRLMQSFVRSHTASWTPRLAVVIASARWIVVLVYLALILYDIRAEYLCLRVLGGDQGLGHYGNDIQNAVVFSFIAVVLIPVVPAILRIQSIRYIKRDITAGSSKDIDPSRPRSTNMKNKI